MLVCEGSVLLKGHERELPELAAVGVAALRW